MRKVGACHFLRYHVELHMRHEEQPAPCRMLRRTALAWSATHAGCTSTPRGAHNSCLFSSIKFMLACPRQASRHAGPCGNTCLQHM
eukprot:360019-Chlamydomonas_euryale.AAC.11